jgi:hypothetical protein
MQSLIGGRIEECKAGLRAVTSEEREMWPVEARKMMNGLAKMRSGGLERLLGYLSDLECEGREALSSWKRDYDEGYRRVRALQTAFERRKQDHYRKIAAWIARSYDVVAWEGDLGLKEMAEDESEEYAIRNSRKWRQYVGLYQLREYVRQAMGKQGKVLIDDKAAYSTRTCSECGGEIQGSAKLVLECENGHRQDQDVNASLNFVQAIPAEYSSSERSRPEIPADLKGWLRPMPA